jgi:hypothetical protein
VSTLITNLPAQHVWVRREYLRDHLDGHGEYVRGVWISAKSIPGRAFYFETYLPDFAAVYDKLPISAFVASPEAPTPDLPLEELQFWNCMDLGVVSVVKQFTASMIWEVRTRRHGSIRGTYICTLDNHHADPDGVDYSTSETPAEHKAFNLLELETGQFALYPNNRCRVYDVSLTPPEPLVPDFRVSTRYYTVENTTARYGDQDAYHYLDETAECGDIIRAHMGAET